MVSEVDRLGPLQVRVAGHRPVGVALRELEQALHQRARQPPAFSRVVAHEEGHVGRHLIVPGPAGVELAADAGRSALSGGARPPCGCPRRPPRLETSRPPPRPRRSSSPPSIRCSSSASSTPARSGPGVGPRLLDVVRGKPPIEADRGVQPREERIGLVAKARHAVQSMNRVGWPPVSARQTRGGRGGEIVFGPRTN